MKKKLESGRFWCTERKTMCTHNVMRKIINCSCAIPLEQKSIRIYISGQISGDHNAREKFAKYARMFRKMGFEVVDPFEVNPNGGEWADCMIQDLREMYKCDAVFMIGVWYRSRGACKERNKAIAFGIPIIYDDVYNKKNVYRALKKIKPYRSMY